VNPVRSARAAACRRRASWWSASAESGRRAWAKRWRALSPHAS